MEENNKPQDPQSPSFGQPDETPQNGAQNTQYNQENTYWENNTPAQNQQASEGQYTNQSTPYTGQPQPANLNEAWTGTNAQQPQQTQTPEQFYQYYQQQMGNQQTNGQQQYQQPYQQGYQQPQYQQGYQPGAYQKPKKKHRGALVAVIIILLLLAGGAVAAFAFKDTLMNTYAKTTKSPAEYYAYVEKNAIEDAVSDITSAENTLQNNKNAAYDVSSDVTVNRDTVDSLLQSSLGMSLSDLESQLGLPLESIGFHAVIGTDGDIVNETVGFNLNKVDLITMEMFMDTAAGKMLLRLPELSDAYLSLSNEDAASSAAQLKKLTPELIAKLLNKYSNILIDNINDVTLEDNDELSIDTLTTNCTKLTVTISEQDAYDIVKEILTEAREDQEIIDLLPMFNLSEEDYQSYVDEALDEMEASADTVTDETATMVVYVNSKGEIIGREFSADGTDASLGYKNLSKDNYDEYTVFVNDDSGESVFSINGSQKKIDGSYDGDATLELNTGSYDEFSNISIDISYEDVYQEKKDNQIFQYGSFTLSSLDLMGIQVSMDYFVEDDVQKSKLVLKMGTSPLLTVDTTSDYIEDYKVTMPPADAEIYDVDQADSYAATFNLEQYIDRLSDKLGVDLQSLLDYYMSGYDY